VTYTLTIHNFGPGTVDEGELDGARVPAALQNFTISVAGGTGVCQFDPTGASLGVPPPGFPIINCDIPQFGPAEDRVITIQGPLAPDSAGTVVDNVAAALSVFPGTDLGAEPDFSNNRAEVSFTPGTVDVGIAKNLLAPTAINVGDVATFRLVASNSGTDAARNVVVTDTLPAGLDPVDLPAGCIAAGQIVSCALGTLPPPPAPAPASTQTIDLQARAGPAAAGTTVTNHASIQTDDADLDPGNDTSSADLTINPLPSPRPPPPPAATPVDLAVTVTPPSGLATVGATGAWTLRVVNNGPGTATNVALTSTPHGNADLVGATLRPAACFTTPGIKCGLGTLAPGASQTVVVDLRPTAAGRLELTGTVTAAEPDTVSTNNTDQAAITIGVSTVKLTATAAPPELTDGSATTITITAVTQSRRPAHNATVCVRVPKGLTIPKPGAATFAQRTPVLADRAAPDGSAPRLSPPRGVTTHDTRPHGRPPAHRAGCRRAHPRARVALRIVPLPLPSPLVTG
jgi:large repetitive protein